MNKTDEKYIGKTFGVLTVLTLANITKSRRSYNCNCSKCGGNTIVRSDHLVKLPKSCGNCVATLQKEIATLKYDPQRTYINKIYRSYVSGAKDRNLEFTITKQQFEDLLFKPCYYCNEEHATGIDRVDSLKGYNSDNIVSCCSICNLMKNKFSQQVFFSKVEKIYNKHLK